MITSLKVNILTSAAPKSKYPMRDAEKVAKIRAANAERLKWSRKN